DCAATWVWIEPGIALDCCGRELLNEARYAFEWPSLPDTGCGPPDLEEVLLCIEYDEKATECAPAILDDCCGQAHSEPSRIRESVRFTYRSAAEASDCWPGRGTTTAVRDDCDSSSIPQGCLEPDCPCGGCVPLAVLTRRAGGAIEIELCAP